MKLARVLGMTNWEPEVQGVSVQAYRDTTGPGLNGTRAMLNRAREQSPVRAARDVAVPIAIIINELVTNSFKYGFPGDRSGQILIALHNDSELVLTVADNGIGISSGDQVKQGVGSKVVALLAQQLDGTLTYETTQPGCRVVLKMPKPML